MKKIFALSLVLASLTLFSCNGSEYDEIKDIDKYLIEAKKLNTVLSAEYELKSGDHIKADISVERGAFSIEIASELEVLYSGNGEVSEFRVGIPEDGEYTIKVEGKNAEGRLEFSIVD